MLITIPLYKKVQSHLDGVLGITRENLTGSRVIRAFCREDEETAEFERRNDVLTAAQKLVGRISALMNPLTYAILNIAVAALIWKGALRVNLGTLTQGEVGEYEARAVEELGPEAVRWLATGEKI